MKIKIERISRKEVETPNGRSPTAWKLGVKSGETWYSCFAAPWNQEWKEGQTIDVEVVQKGNFWNILPPKKTQQTSAHDSTILDEIKNQNTQIMKELLEIKAMLVKPVKKLESEFGEEPHPIPEPPQDDTPFPDEESLPF